MTVGIDTSVLVRVLTGLPEAQAAEALRHLMQLGERGSRVLVSDLVLAEAYFALQYHYRISKKDALDALRVFLQSPFVEASGTAPEILALPRLESAKPGFVDRLIRLQYLRGAAEEVLTFEKAAARLRGVTVLAG